MSRRRFGRLAVSVREKLEVDGEAPCRYFWLRSCLRFLG